MADTQDTGRSPNGSGHSALQPEHASRLGHSASVPNALTFIQCDANCIEGKHDFQGWREFEDGLGGETVCAKCGMGALEYTLKLGV